MAVFLPAEEEGPESDDEEEEDDNDVSFPSVSGVPRKVSNSEKFGNV